jgi:putative tryptophan/tyrosine transport system substrate-binding protein
LAQSLIHRREFITLLGGAAVAWPLSPVGAQAKRPRIGVLVPANPEPFWTEFRAGLDEHGYAEGKNIAFEFRSADGKPERLHGLADELVRLKVDIIVAWLTPAVAAARRATTDIPIIMAAAADRVATGLIFRLARPGGNITGLSNVSSERYVKLLELVPEALPSARRVGILLNAASPFSGPLVEQLENVGRTLAIGVHVIKLRGTDEFGAAFSAIEKERADVIILQASLPRRPALDLAMKHHLPLVGASRPIADAGGLIAYSANQNDQYRRAAYYVDRGAKPSDLPVEQPTKFVLIINLKTAKALGPEFPPTLLARADEVIE